MKKVFYWLSILCFLFIFSQSAFGYLGKSIRLMSIGDELTGVIEDEYTDIHRNPAYLSFIEKPRIFGQYNLYWYPEVKIADYFQNQKTGLLGVVLPLSDYGNFALIGELKPSSNEDGHTEASRVEYIDYYIADSFSVNSYRKESIQNFKAIYSLKLSPSLRLGIDFVYLKNYDDSESENHRIITQRYSGSDSLKSYGRTDMVNNLDNSPDVQRGSLGLILNPWSKTTLDFTLYYEKLSYISQSSSIGESQTVRFGIDTTFKENHSNHT